METDVRVEVFLKHKYQFQYIQSFHYMKTIKHMMIRDSCAECVTAREEYKGGRDPEGCIQC